jgi:1-acyl-sn-glycerol-3-phosphate acyltransferase
LWVRLWLRTEYHGQEHIPLTGPCIVASNHVSYLDPPVVGSGLSRVVNFIARDTLAKNAFMRWYYAQIGVILMDRDRGDVAALRKGLDVLKQGGVLALFPEGTRSHDGRLQKPKSGIGFLIARADVPVVPTFVDGTYQAFPRGARFVKPRKVHVYYGEPVTTEEIRMLGRGKQAYQQVAELVMKRIAALRQSVS